MGRVWTAAQIKKLETIIGKLETLQAEVDDPARWLDQSKSRLLDVLRDVEQARNGRN